MASFSLGHFQAQVLGGRGLARPNRFEVMIIPPAALSQYGGLVSLLCEQATLPMLTVGVKPFKIHNTPAYQRPVNIEYGGEGVSFVFHLDGDMLAKRFFDDWMHLIGDKDSYAVNYQENYATSIYIAQLNELEQITYEVELTEAFPRNLNLITLDNTAQNQTHRLTVLFNYRIWKDVQRAQFIERSDPYPSYEPQTYNHDDRLL